MAQVLVLLLAASAGWAQPAPAGGCASLAPAPCWESPELLVLPRALRQSAQGGYNFVTLTLQFQNRSGRALALAYSHGGTVVTDNRGNRFAVHGKATGLPLLQGQATPMDFVLAPGGSREATIEFQLYGNVAVGPQYDLVLAAREILATSNGRSENGPEQAVALRGLVQGTTSPGLVAGSGAVPAPAATAPAPAAAPAAGASPCQGLPHCVSEGVLVAQLLKISTQRTDEVDDEQHAAVFLRLTNRGDKPLALAHRLGSAQLVDSRGNVYKRHGAGDAAMVKVLGVLGAPGEAGMLVIEPGASRNVVLRHLIEQASRARLSASYNYEISLAELDAASGRVRHDYLARYSKVTAQELQAQPTQSEFERFQAQENKEFQRSRQ